jgi:hypothetical protein
MIILTLLIAVCEMGNALGKFKKWIMFLISYTICKTDFRHSESVKSVKKVAKYKIDCTTDSFSKKKLIQSHFDIKVELSKIVVIWLP